MVMAGPPRKYEKLMENGDLRRWVNEMARTSKITADTYLRRLGSFCMETKLTPPALIEWDEKDVTDVISDYISRAQERTLAGAYILSTVKAVKSWLTYNNRKLTRKIRIGDTNANSTLKDERIPTQQELKAILAAGDPRSRVACILMAHSGMRPEVLGNYMGDNGLKIGDFPDIKIENERVSFERIPAMIVVRPELSKARKQYITFIGSEGCFYISSLVESRIREGEKVGMNSPLITPSKMALRNEKSHIRTINIGDIVRGSIRATSFKGRPYVLSSYFDTQLMLAESKGLILRDYRQFFMGHVGDIEHRYTVNKHRLPEDVIEDMRTAYQKCLKFLETEEHGIKEEDYVKQLRESGIMAVEIITGLKFTDEEREKLLSMSIEEFQDKLREVTKDKQAMALNNGNRHKTIPERELEAYLNKGWELIQIYPKGDKAVIKLPS